MFNSNKELNSQKYLKFTLCLIATSESGGDSNSVLLMNIGVSNLVKVHFKITEAGVSVGVSLMLLLVI